MNRPMGSWQLVQVEFLRSMKCIVIGWNVRCRQLLGTKLLVVVLLVMRQPFQNDDDSSLNLLMDMRSLAERLVGLIVRLFLNDDNCSLIHRLDRRLVRWLVVRIVRPLFLRDGCNCFLNLLMDTKSLERVDSIHLNCFRDDSSRIHCYRHQLWLECRLGHFRFGLKMKTSCIRIGLSHR